MESIINGQKASAADLPGRPLGTADLADRAVRAARPGRAVGGHGDRRYREIHAGAAAVPMLPAGRDRDGRPPVRARGWPWPLYRYHLT